MAATDAYVYGHELVTIPAPTTVRSGFSFGYEFILTQAPAVSKDGFAYGYEVVRITDQGTALVKNGYTYGYENVANNSNPTQLKRWDGAQWIRSPYYVWNGTAWVHVT